MDEYNFGLYQGDLNYISYVRYKYKGKKSLYMCSFSKKKSYVESQDIIVT